MVLIALTEQDRHVQRGVLSEVEDERLVWRPVPLKAGRVVEVGGQGPGGEGQQCLVRVLPVGVPRAPAEVDGEACFSAVPRPGLVTARPGVRSDPQPAQFAVKGPAVAEVRSEAMMLNRPPSMVTRRTWSWPCQFGNSETSTRWVTVPLPTSTVNGPA